MARLYRVEFESGPFVGTAEDLVARLHKASRAPAEDHRLWMKQTAARIKLQSGIAIRSRSYDTFAQDLIANEYVHQLDKGE